MISHLIPIHFNLFQIHLRGQGRRCAVRCGRLGWRQRGGRRHDRQRGADVAPECVEQHDRREVSRDDLAQFFCCY